MAIQPKSTATGLAQAYIRLAQLTATSRTRSVHRLLEEFAQRLLGEKLTPDEFMDHIAGESAIPSELKRALWKKLQISEMPIDQLAYLVRNLPETTADMFDFSAWYALRNRKPTARLLYGVLSSCESARVAVSISGFLLDNRRVTKKIADLIRNRGNYDQKRRAENILQPGSNERRMLA